MDHPTKSTQFTFNFARRRSKNLIENISNSQGDRQTIKLRIDAFPFDFMQALCGVSGLRRYTTIGSTAF